jgi:hypothetical protein
MKMDALHFLKKTDKKKSKKSAKVKKPVCASLKPPVDLSNPWAIFTVVDKNIFTQVIDDFVRRAKWKDKKNRAIIKKPGQPRTEFKIDLENIDYEYVDAVLNMEEWKNIEDSGAQEDIQINKILDEIDAEYIRMFYNLRMYIPWYTAIHFLKEYADDNRGMLAPDLYKFYIDTSEMIALKNQTAQYLQKRIAKTAKISSKELNNPQFRKIFTGSNQSPTYIYPPPCVEAVKSKIKNKHTFAPIGANRLAIPPPVLLINPVRYRDWETIDTSWLYEYGIVGFVVSEKANILATPIEVKYDDKTWYKVNKLFYKHLYTARRNFIPGLIGYIMQDSSIVPETAEMFERLGQHFEMKETKSRLASGYDAAIYIINQDVLLNSIYTVKDLLSFATKIVESFKPCYSTRDIAKKLSFVLVYYRRLVNVEQSYIENTRKKLYAPENLLNLKKDVLLPEVYSLPNNDPRISEAGHIIAQIRRDIETAFYVQLSSRVLPEEGRVRVRPQNPQNITKKGTSTQLINGEKLAPGLLQKLKTLINVKDITKCALCNESVYNPSYKSICSSETHTFCNQECFENFKFKK